MVISDQEERPETDRIRLRSLFLPLMLEQLLNIAVGMADTVMVSSAGEAAVSGISLVDQLNVLLIQVFAALSTGGTVVASQYLGRGKRENAIKTGMHLVYACFLVSLLVAVPCLFFRRPILSKVFGGITPRSWMRLRCIFSFRPCPIPCWLSTIPERRCSGAWEKCRCPSGSRCL